MVVTVTRPVPPLEGIGLGDKDNPISHFTGVGPTVIDEVAPQAALRSHDKRERRTLPGDGVREQVQEMAGACENAAYVAALPSWEVA